MFAREERLMLPSEKLEGSELEAALDKYQSEAVIFIEQVEQVFKDLLGEFDEEFEIRKNTSTHQGQYYVPYILRGSSIYIGVSFAEALSHDLIPYASRQAEYLQALNGEDYSDEQSVCCWLKVKTCARENAAGITLSVQYYFCKDEIARDNMAWVKYINPANDGSQVSEKSGYAEMYLTKSTSKGTKVSQWLERLIPKVLEFACGPTV